MVTKIVMPKLSLTMKDGTIGKWYKKEGDSVQKGEPIVEIISEKATYDLEAPATGILKKIFFEEGTNAPVNAILALITAPEEKLSEVQLLAEAKPSEELVEETEKKIIASPAAKRLAREHGIDLSSIKGSGPDGRIVEEDVKKAIAEKQLPQLNVQEIIPLTGFRKTTAERVSLSFRTAPHSVLMMDVDFSRAKALHEKFEVSYTAVLVAAVGKALLENPMLNSTLEGDKIKIFKDINVGVAVATQHGLVVPVIHHADKKSLREINQALNELIEKAQQGKLSKEEITGGTFTITNLGMYGVDLFIPIINPPEAAILGVGRVIEKPIVVNGRIEIKPIAALSLSYDHRIVDGAPAAKFLQRIKYYVENLEVC